MSQRGSGYEIARALERPIGRGGGMRDPLPGNARERFNRDKYVVCAVPRETKPWVVRQAEQRGLSYAAFCGMVIERAAMLTGDDLDDFLAG